MSKKRKTPWPTDKVMKQIYEEHLWGGNDCEFYSGEGSHNPDIVAPYLEAVIAFLKSHDRPLAICDLGCGDFNIGKQLTAYASRYIAIDIVDSLIERNIATFRSDNLEFQCLDIAKDELPEADCIILRQVLQHLSNNDIKSIAKKLSNYQYLILTEHVPTGAFVPNKDIITGQGNRVKQHSGVDLLVAPFNLKIKQQTLLSKVVLDKNQGQIVTTLYRL